MPRFEPHPERRAAVVTGASSGHGTAIATALAAAGHPVVVGARRLDRLEELVAKITADGGQALAVPLDLTDAASIRTFAARAEDELGPIEILVSNAGDVQPITTLADPDEFHRQLQVNLLGAQSLVHELVPHMVARQRGDVVFVTSEVAQDPRTYMAAYVASKAGLEGYARAMAMECEGTGVRVGIVRPGPSSTEQGTTWDADTIETVVGSWYRWGLLRHDGAIRPSEFAQAVLAVVSAPKGTRYALLEVQPEAPVAAPADTVLAEYGPQASAPPDAADETRPEGER
ncbi:SDR family oxidoreductase [Dermatobacter hominis]|uniref:SDR family oxidoreductase n=1 Tax=Dermatobacter hominis TaxID=2884263 RepID=UPI001D114347|nr:SDR family oxidoreductase [Dermatobacter hominis]UDY37404.1 SDR family oxidoreductase [Dermatobacter hominis]